MLVIKVWCLPLEQGEESLNRLHQSIVATVTSITELGLKDENDMVCLFPADLMKYGLGEEIIIEISGLRQLQGLSLDDACRIDWASFRDQFAEKVGQVVKNLYPRAKVECHVEDPAASVGFWASG